MKMVSSVALARTTSSVKKDRKYVIYFETSNYSFIFARSYTR